MTDVATTDEVSETTEHHQPAGVPEVTTADGTVVAVGPGLTALAEWCEEKLAHDEADNTRYMEDAVAAILAGTSVEEVLSTGSTTIDGKTVAGRPFLAHGFRISRSGYEEGMPWYGNIEAEMLDNRERLIVNTGAPKVLATLKMLEEFGEWPTPVEIKANTTKQGFTVLDLVKAGASKKDS